MATFDQVTVSGKDDGPTEVGFQTNAAEGGPIVKGAEITGDSVGVKGIAGVIGPDQQAQAPDEYGSGVYGISGASFPSGSGVTGQGAPATVAGQVPGPAPVPPKMLPPGPPGGAGVMGYGGQAAAGETFIIGEDGTQYPQGYPAGAGVSGVGGAGINRVGGADGAPGPGVMGQGGTPAVAGQPGGRGGVFMSAAQAQVRLVPVTDSGGNPPALPASGQAGDLFVRSQSDAEAELWFCVSGTDSDPGVPVVWAQVHLVMFRGPG